MGQVRLRTEQRIAIIEIANDGKLNAFTRAMRARIGELLAATDGDRDAIGAVVTGAGDAFCSGQDLNESATWTAETPWVEEFGVFFRALLRFRKPLVAALNGVAAGGGFQMALLCDKRIGHAKTRMGQTEVRRGLASVTGTWLLQRAVGDARGRELALSGRLMEADELHRIGLLDRIVAKDEVLAAALEACIGLAASPADSYARTKTWIYESLSNEMNAVLLDAARLHREGFASGVSQAGAQRFLSHEETRAG